MKSRNNYLIRLIILLLLPIVINPIVIAENNPLLSETEINENIKKYLNIVFEGRGTLADYRHYHGIHNVSELTLESESIDFILGSGSEPLAKKIIELRNNNSQSVPSVFFKKLTKYYPLELDTIKITKIEKNKRKNNKLFYLATVVGYSHQKQKDITYKIFHSADRVVVKNGGFIDIIEIDGKPINSMIEFN